MYIIVLFFKEVVCSLVDHVSLDIVSNIKTKIGIACTVIVPSCIGF